MTLDMEGGQAALDLRTASGHDLEAHEPTADGAWTAYADQGHVEGNGQMVADKVHGDIVSGGRKTTFESPSARWDPATHTLNMDQKVTVHGSDGAVLTADSAVFRPDEHRVTGHGHVHITRGKGVLDGDSGELDTRTQVAVMDHFTAVSGETTVRAARGELPPDGGPVLLSGGVTATRGQQRAESATARWSAESGLDASGDVRLSAPGMVARGSHLTAPPDMTHATLTPVRATGQSEEGGDWQVSSPRGDWSSAGELDLKGSANGVFTSRSRHATITAGGATYDSNGKVVHFRDGFHLESPSDGLTVTSRRALYRPADQFFEAEDDVHAHVRGVAVRQGKWVYRLGHREDEPIGEGSKDSAEASAKSR